MKKKNITGLIILLFFALNVNAQMHYSEEGKVDLKNINAFTFGAPVHSIEDNFTNLFRNVPQLIDNPDSLKFLDYRYVATIQNKEQAIDYFLKNFHENAPLVHYFVVGHSTVIDVSRWQDFNKEGSIKVMERWIDHKNIHKGYKVYQINLMVNSEKIHYYVFVNPRTKQVVITQFTFFGSIPQNKRIK